MSVHQFSVKDISEQNIELSQYAGKVLLIVNTASKCGFTPQYKELEELYQKYSGKLEILAFPCNQFGGQEPGDNSEIQNFCDLTFQTTFPLFSKIEVNGDNADPLYQYMKKEAKGLMGSEKIKWNFTKFLVDQSGRVVKRFAPQTSPLSMIKEIEELF